MSEQAPRRPDDRRDAIEADRKRTSSLLAFHNSPALKEKCIAHVRKHNLENADFLLTVCLWGKERPTPPGYWDYSVCETEIGVPIVLALVQETIALGLPDVDRKAWPELFLSSIQPGAPLLKIWPRFASWLLDDPTDGIIRFEKSEEEKRTVSFFAQLYRDNCLDHEQWLFKPVANEITHHAKLAALGDTGGALYSACPSVDGPFSADNARKAVDYAAELHGDEESVAAHRIRQSQKLLDLIRSL